VVLVKKLLILAAAAGGYVLGTKAGRERYEQIKRHSSKLWNSEPVQYGVHEAEDVAKQAASVAGSRVADVATTATSKVAAKVKSDGSSEPSEPAPPPIPAETQPAPGVTAVDDPPPPEPKRRAKRPASDSDS
jgi:hypothetical protein